MNQKFRRIVAIIAVFSIVWVGLSLALPKKKTVTQPQETTAGVTPGVKFADLIEPTEGKVNPEAISSIKEKLPFRNDDFSIIYFEKTQELSITIQQGKFEEKKQKALQWLKDNGVTEPENLPILWSKTRWVE